MKFVNFNLNKTEFKRTFIMKYIVIRSKLTKQEKSYLKLFAFQSSSSPHLEKKKSIKCSYLINNDAKSV